MNNPVNVTWRKSSRSGNQSNCVEIAPVIRTEEAIKPDTPSVRSSAQ